MTGISANQHNLAAPRRYSTNSQELNRSVPRSFSRHALYRFTRERRRAYLSDLGGPPDRRQAGLIDILISAEWDWLRFDAEANHAEGRQADEKRRMAAECRRQYLLAGRELDRVTPKKAAASASPSLDEILRDIGVTR
jgi:hypothetical protein